MAYMCKAWYGVEQARCSRCSTRRGAALRPRTFSLPHLSSPYCGHVAIWWLCHGAWFRSDGPSKGISTNSRRPCCTKTCLTLAVSHVYWGVLARSLPLALSRTRWCWCQGITVPVFLSEAVDWQGYHDDQARVLCVAVKAIGQLSCCGMQRCRHAVCILL
jgi:hypothetical protein